MSKSSDSRRDLLIYLLLALVTVVLYLPLASFEFNNYDDAQYITDNTRLQSGLTAENLAWAFTSGYASNWHPLTWISHMLDCQIYGLKPGGHHLTNLLFHVANSLLLFGLLRRLTGAFWRSAMVAALFAWHPVHVESVAWVAERKDVLSTFFALLTVWAYVAYTKTPTRARYCLVIIYFALGLMAKPMLVTLPLVLLLLDYWPLHRLRVFPVQPFRSYMPLVREKLPLFVLTAVLCCVTFLVQKAGGSVALSGLPFPYRAENALVSCVRYIGKIFWPTHLSIFYPYPPSLPLWEVLGAGLLLVGICAWAGRCARNHPYVAAGWFWFLITLIPVIGLVQVGDQAMADRYTYIPAIGLFLIVTWGANELAMRWSRTKWLMGMAAVLVLAGCLVGTTLQVRYWRNSFTLFNHALEVTTDNAVAHSKLAEAFATKGDFKESLAHYNEVLRIKPGDAEAENSIGTLFYQQNKFEEASAHFNAALKVRPNYDMAYYNLGLLLLQEGKPGEAIEKFQSALKFNARHDKARTSLGQALTQQGKLDEAIEQYREALKYAPQNPYAQNSLADALDRKGKLEEAIPHYLAALQSKPDLVEAHYNLGNALISQGKINEAAGHYSEAVRFRPDYMEAHFNLGNILIQQKQWDAAVGHYAEVLRLKPDFVDAHANMGIALTRQGKTSEAVAHYRAALQLDPRSVTALKKLAWILATNPNAKLRDGAEAVRLSALALEVNGAADANAWDIRGAACAEAGQFAEAASAAKKAIDLATASQHKEVITEMQNRLRLYEAGQAFHESATP
ncbi:MAG: Tetratricopeptide 2 repeat protein [Pedosphaera sp.]|nr:Tetratricopeptide 2 repeat protein [Pedosphaera sp.]